MQKFTGIDAYLLGKGDVFKFNYENKNVWTVMGEQSETVDSYFDLKVKNPQGECMILNFYINELVYLQS